MRLRVPPGRIIERINDFAAIQLCKPVSRGEPFHEATLLFSLPDYCSDLAEIAILHPTRAVPLENILGGAHIGLAPELPIAWSHWSNRAGEDLIDVALCHFYLRDLGSALRGWSYKPPTTKH